MAALSRFVPRVSATEYIPKTYAPKPITLNELMNSVLPMLESNDYYIKGGKAFEYYYVIILIFSSIYFYFFYYPVSTSITN
jgi:hypothetical protein